MRAKRCQAIFIAVNHTIQKELFFCAAVPKYMKCTLVRARARVSECPKSIENWDFRRYHKDKDIFGEIITGCESSLCTEHLE